MEYNGVSIDTKYLDDLSESNNTYMYPFSVGKIYYTQEWIESDATASEDNYKWVTLATFLSEGLRFISKSYSAFANSYISREHFDDLGDIFSDEFFDNESIVHAGDAGIFSSQSKFTALCRKYCTLESTIISDEDRYNMLDTEICFA